MELVIIVSRKMLPSNEIFDAAFTTMARNKARRSRFFFYVENLLEAAHHKIFISPWGKKERNNCRNCRNK